MVGSVYLRSGQMSVHGPSFLRCARAALRKEVIAITKKKAKATEAWLAVTTATVTLLVVLAQLVQVAVEIISHH